MTKQMPLKPTELDLISFGIGREVCLNNILGLIVSPRSWEFPKGYSGIRGLAWPLFFGSVSLNIYSRHGNASSTSPLRVRTHIYLPKKDFNIQGGDYVLHSSEGPNGARNERRRLELLGLFGIS